MYIPKIYKNENSDAVKNFIRENGFGILVSAAGDRPAATHIPLELEKNEEGKDILSWHISKANPQWKSFGDGQNVLAIFNGPHTYISSSWYDHENVSTWNYIAVHVYGRLKIISDEKLLQALKRLTARYESHSENPATVEKMSEKFVQKEMKGVVGFEIEIEEMHPAWKLSQNRDAANHEAIVKELEKRGDAQSRAIAEEMKKSRK
jgi:transcriptional regulator